MTTERRTVERYPRSARRYHSAVYITTLLLLATGWWLLTGREGQPSPLAALVRIPDVQLHVWFGWALVAVALVPLPFVLRGVVAFVRETVRYDRGDGRWFRTWPRAALTGRFAHHEGHFDPGQRVLNVAIVVLLATLVATGIALTLVKSGPVFAWLVLIHRAGTAAFTFVIVGHIVVAAGFLPGYRGVWRAMHVGGRLRFDTARRLWPGWAERVGTGQPDRAAAPAIAERPSSGVTDRPSGTGSVDAGREGAPAMRADRAPPGPTAPR